MTTSQKREKREKEREKKREKERKRGHTQNDVRGSLLRSFGRMTNHEAAAAVLILIFFFLSFLPSSPALYCFGFGGFCSLARSLVRSFAALCSSLTKIVVIFQIADQVRPGKIRSENEHSLRAFKRQFHLCLQLTAVDKRERPADPETSERDSFPRVETDRKREKRKE